MNVTELRLPLPPSVNGLYRNVRGKGRAKSKRYKAWLDEAGWSVRIQRPVPVLGPYRMEITLGAFNDKRRRDDQNYIKAIPDLLQKLGVISDDSNSRFTGAGWGTDVPAGECVVRIYPQD